MITSWRGERWFLPEDSSLAIFGIFFAYFLIKVITRGFRLMRAYLSCIKLHLGFQRFVSININFKNCSSLIVSKG